MSRRAIVTMGLGPRYQPLIGRLLTSLHKVEDPTACVCYINCIPPGAPRGIELPWLAYCAKPYAMRAAAEQGFDRLLWLDAACYAVRHLEPLWGFVESQGYYVQQNGWSFGEFCSDAALKTLGFTREEAMGIPDISTCAVGLDLRNSASLHFLNAWCRLASDGVTFMGEHCNDIGPAAEKGVAYRSVGHVSDDKRVIGARHDQTAASALVHRLGWTRTPRPEFVDYYDKDKLDSRTVVVNRGGL